MPEPSFLGAQSANISILFILIFFLFVLVGCFVLKIESIFTTDSTAPRSGAGTPARATTAHRRVNGAVAVGGAPAARCVVRLLQMAKAAPAVLLLLLAAAAASPALSAAPRRVTAPPAGVLGGRRRPLMVVLYRRWRRPLRSPLYPGAANPSNDAVRVVRASSVRVVVVAPICFRGRVRGSVMGEALLRGGGGGGEDGRRSGETVRRREALNRVANDVEHRRALWLEGLVVALVGAAVSVPHGQVSWRRGGGSAGANGWRAAGGRCCCWARPHA